MQTSTTQRIDPRFFVRVTISEGDPVDSRDVRHAIESLGGVPEGGCFAFPTLQARAIAMDVLGDKFGMRYVRCVGTSDDSSREIAAEVS